MTANLPRCTVCEQCMLQGPSASSKVKDVQNLQALEAQVKQLQSRLGYMEEEKGRLVAAAKGKNEQVSEVYTVTTISTGSFEHATGQMSAGMHK